MDESTDIATSPGEGEQNHKLKAVLKKMAYYAQFDLPVPELAAVLGVKIDWLKKELADEDSPIYQANMEARAGKLVEAAEMLYRAMAEGDGAMLVWFERTRGKKTVIAPLKAEEAPVDVTVRVVYSEELDAGNDQQD